VYIPFQVFGLQPNSEPPVWVFSKAMQLKLENNEVIKLSEDDSPYTIVGENSSSYSYQGTK
jgi:hypothetical protein